DNSLKAAANIRSDLALRSLKEKNEVGFENFMTPARAEAAVKVERTIQSRFGQSLNASRNQLRDPFLDRFSHQPELLSQFAVQQPSEELKQSRGRVKSMLEEARRKTATR